MVLLASSAADRLTTEDLQELHMKWGGIPRRTLVRGKEQSLRNLDRAIMGCRLNCLEYVFVAGMLRFVFGHERVREELTCVLVRRFEIPRFEYLCFWNVVD